jgi:hypothetical protein
LSAENPTSIAHHRCGPGEPALACAGVDARVTETTDSDMGRPEAYNTKRSRINKLDIWRGFGYCRVDDQVHP